MSTPRKAPEDKLPTGRKKESIETKMGRITVDPAMVGRISLAGLTDEQVAFILGVSEGTILNWSKDPAFFEARKKGKITADLEVIESAWKRAKGYDVVETTVTRYPKIIKQANEATRLLEDKVVQLEVQKTVTKHIAPDPTAFIWWLNNRMHELWKARITHEVEGKLEANINYGTQTLKEMHDMLEDLLTKANFDKTLATAMADAMIGPAPKAPAITPGGER